MTGSDDMDKKKTILFYYKGQHRQIIKSDVLKIKID